MKKRRVALPLAAAALIATLAPVPLLGFGWVRLWVEPAGYALAALLLAAWGILTAVRARRKLLKVALALLCAALVLVALLGSWVSWAYHATYHYGTLVSPSGRNRAVVRSFNGGRFESVVYPVRARVWVDTRRARTWQTNISAYTWLDDDTLEIALTPQEHTQEEPRKEYIRF